ncbi:hypothetical protein [Komagataeibacter nataicola]|nr:hypothetical protein [Komagataeibacter nataicola]WNM09158.1 hypothetical protein RI056_03760 [Komagataeibacter nataicola]
MACPPAQGAVVSRPVSVTAFSIMLLSAPPPFLPPRLARSPDAGA